MRRPQKHHRHAVAAAALLLTAALGARAQDAESSSVPPEAQKQFDIAAAAAKKAVESMGIALFGYTRTGAYYATDGLPRGHYGLGDLGYNRLGNEGDNYLEFGIGKKWDLGGVKLGTYYQPNFYKAQGGGAGTTGVAQAYVDLSGFAFAPEVSFWGGQRFHRIMDVHIIDNFLLDDGDNVGAGVEGIKLGGAGTLNVSAYTDTTVGGDSSTSNGKRLNLQWRKIPLNAGGTLDIAAGVVRGNFADKKTGFALGGMYRQKAGALTNSLVVQGSNGHADLRGKFYNLNGQATTTVGSPFICTVTPNADGSCPTAGIAPNPNLTTATTTTFKPAAKQFRIVDSIDWQTGPFGGQAFVGYQTLKPEDTGKTTKNFGMGARLSYGVSRYVKLYGDVNLSSLKTEGKDTQRMDKETIAIALAPDSSFWSRPEIRLYVTRVGGNDAVRAAGTFGGRSSATLAGVQVEAWWE